MGKWYVALRRGRKLLYALDGTRIDQQRKNVGGNVERQPSLMNLAAALKETVANAASRRNQSFHHWV